MKELVIISGKGGTGKTSLTASFAKLAENQVLADCDVDAADLYLLLQPQVSDTHPFYSGHIAEISADKCEKCGLCLEKCKFDAVSITDNTYKIDPLNCEGCKVCVHFCPAEAISFYESQCGEWYESTITEGPMIHARLTPGAENSGKLVTLVRKKAAESAAKSNRDLILVDGPPGIGCPVIAAVTGSNAVIAVTEPTLSGKHDLERLLGLTKHFGIKAYIIINKADLNLSVSTEIQNLAKESQVEILGEIPYSPLFPQALAKGKTVIEFAPYSEPAKMIRSIWNKIMQKEIG